MQLPELTPEQAKELFAPGELQDKQKNFQRQLMMAQALRDRGMQAGQGHSTGWGALGGGLANMLDSYRAGRMQRAADAGLNAMPQEMSAARSRAYNTARLMPFYFGSQRPNEPPAVAGMNMIGGGNG
jgi:hypothetical protein